MEVVHNNPGNSKASQSDDVKVLYKVLNELPKPDFHFKLNTNQKYWYNKIGKVLISTNQLTEPDLIHLANLAVALDTNAQAVKAMNDKGYNGGVIQTFSTGAQQISPHMVAQKMARATIKEISEHFGFGFKDRKKLGTQSSAPDGQLSLFEEIKKVING